MWLAACSALWRDPGRRFTRRSTGGNRLLVSPVLCSLGALFALLAALLLLARLTLAITGCWCGAVVGVMFCGGSRGAAVSAAPGARATWSSATTSGVSLAALAAFACVVAHLAPASPDDPDDPDDPSVESAARLSIVAYRVVPCAASQAMRPSRERYAKVRSFANLAVARTHCGRFLRL